MKVEVDYDKCVCAGRCVVAAPEVFDQREEDGLVILLDENPPESQHARARKAARLCPAVAIKIVE